MSIAVSVVIIVAIYAAKPGPITTPTSRPKATTLPTITSAPAIASAKAKIKYPSETLIKACKQTALALRKRLDAEFIIHVQEPFVIAAAVPASRLESYAKGSIIRPVEAMWTSYFRKKPDKPITVLLFTGAPEYRLWTEKLFKDRDLPHYGYYRPGDRTLVMDISTGTGTLVHELTHALIVYDFPAIPTWFNEGLASLHEQCSIGKKELTGLTNWRLPALQQAIRTSKLRPLRELVTQRDFYGQLRGLNYAQARYFVMYMQKQGLLQQFYVHFRENHTAKDADVKAIEHVFGKPLGIIEKECLVWVKTLKYGR